MVEFVKGRQGDYQSAGRRAATINQVLKGWAKPIIEKIKEFKKTGDKKLFVSKQARHKKATKATRLEGYLTNREATMLRKANLPKDVVEAIAKEAGITVPEFRQYQKIARTIPRVYKRRSENWRRVRKSRKSMAS